jgi:hypothetical protein
MIGTGTARLIGVARARVIAIIKTELVSEQFALGLRRDRLSRMSFNQSDRPFPRPICLCLFGVSPKNAYPKLDKLDVQFPVTACIRVECGDDRAHKGDACHNYGGDLCWLEAKSD